MFSVMIPLPFLIVSLAMILLAFWAGFTVQREGSNETISDLKYRLADSKYEESRAKATERSASAMTAMESRMETLEKAVMRVDTNVVMVTAKTFKDRLFTTDTQAGEERNDLEKSMGRAVRRPNPFDLSIPHEEGFVVDGKTIPPQESPSNAIVFAKPT